MFSKLEPSNKKTRPRIRIVSETSSLEQVIKVWNPKSKSNKPKDLLIVSENIVPSFSRFPEGCKVGNRVRKLGLDSCHVSKDGQRGAAAFICSEFVLEFRLLCFQIFSV